MQALRRQALSASGHHTPAHMKPVAVYDPTIDAVISIANNAAHVNIGRLVRLSPRAPSGGREAWVSQVSSTPQRSRA